MNSSDANAENRNADSSGLSPSVSQWKNSSSHSSVGRGGFATTSWSMVIDAGNLSSNDVDGHQALERLCQIYWYPLYAFVRRKGNNHADAEELTQEFFTHLLSRDRLKLVDQERGRFRTYLLRSLENFMIGQWRKQNTEKRGGRVTVKGIDFQDGQQRYLNEPSDELTPEKMFDRKWAIQILSQVLQQLESEYHSRGKDRLFRALKPVLTNESDQSYAVIAASLSMNEIAVKVAAHRMRQKYRKLLCQMIEHTVENPDQVEGEIRELFAALQG